MDYQYDNIKKQILFEKLIKYNFVIDNLATFSNTDIDYEYDEFLTSI